MTVNTVNEVRLISFSAPDKRQDFQNRPIIDCAPYNPMRPKSDWSVRVIVSMATALTNQEWAC